MENLNIEHTKGKGFQLTDFPNAQKVVALHGTKSQQLADMAAHMHDLNEASRCLDFFEKSTDLFSQSIFAKMAIILIMKCFSKNNARKYPLKIEEILSSDHEGRKIFSYYKELRDKNIAHDDNAFYQCIPGAVINKEDAEYKIEKVVCFSAKGEVLDIGDVHNLRLIIGHSIKFTEAQFDQLCDELTQELEARSHEELIKMPQLEYKKPIVEDMGKNRGKVTAPPQS